MCRCGRLKPFLPVEIYLDTTVRSEFSWNVHAVLCRSSSHSEKRGSRSSLIVVAHVFSPPPFPLRDARSGVRKTGSQISGDNFTPSHLYYRYLSWEWIKSTAFSNGFVSLLVCIVLIDLAKIMWNRMLVCAAHTKRVLFVTHCVGVFTLGFNMLQRLPCQC